MPDHLNPLDDELDCDDDMDSYDDEQLEELCSLCGRPTAGEECCGCGSPLCPMCFECGGGFCGCGQVPDWPEDDEEDPDGHR